MGGDRDKYRPDRPVFIGNFAYEEDVHEVRRVMERYGPVESIDMKTGNVSFDLWRQSAALQQAGFAFVYMKDIRDGEDAIRDLEGKEFGIKRRPLRMDWARGDSDIKRREQERRKKTTPSTTLFVVNFDVIRTRERDLADLFGRYGPLRRVQIKKKFAFVEFEEVDQAETALNDTNQTSWNGRTINVEYVSREADGRRPGDEPVRPYEERRRMRSRSPVRSSRRRSYSRSRSPVRRSRRRSYSRSPTPPPRRSRRRSYSRSPTPPPRSSRRSPTRSRSPLDGKRSPTPRKRSLSPRGRSLSPRKRSLSPRKRSLSPRRSVSRSPKRSPRRKSPSPSASPRRSASRSPRRSYSRSPLR